MYKRIIIQKASLAKSLSIHPCVFVAISWNSTINILVLSSNSQSLLSLLEVKFPYETRLLVDWLVGRSVCHNFPKSMEFHFQASNGVLIFVKTLENLLRNEKVSVNENRSVGKFLENFVLLPHNCVMVKIFRPQFLSLGFHLRGGGISIFS